MTSRSEGRLTSQVRSHQRRAELLVQRPAPRALEQGDPQRRTSRFRLEKISLLPFVPGSLVAYVERTRGRRRARVVAGVLVAVAMAGVAAFLWIERTRLEQSDQPGANPNGAVAPIVLVNEAAPALGSEPELEVAPPADALHEVSSDQTGSRERPAPASARKPHDQASRPARQPSPSSSSAWWW